MTQRLREGIVATLQGDQHHLLFLITELKTITRTVNKLNIFHFIPSKNSVSQDGCPYFWKHKTKSPPAYAEMNVLLPQPFYSKLFQTNGTI